MKAGCFLATTMMLSLSSGYAAQDVCCSIAAPLNLSPAADLAGWPVASFTETVPLLGFEFRPKDSGRLHYDNERNEKMSL